MFQFLVRLASRQGSAASAPAPREALAVVQQQLSLPTRLLEGELGEFGRWASLVPDGPGAFSLLDVASQGPLSVLLFGQLDAVGSKPAEQVLRSYAAGGARAVNALDGVFCAVIVDDASSVALLVTDVVGQRAPRFLLKNGELSVASHELALHAIAGRALQLDAQATLSLVACDWSLGGHSLYRGIGTLPSGSYLRYAGGDVTLHELPLLGVESRLEPGDERGIAACTEDIIERLRASVRRGLASEPPGPRPLALTAGLDSRMLLALALSVHEPQHDVLTVTRGGRRSQDVVWARRVARLSGVRHQVEVEPSIEADFFLGNANLMALATDGTGNSKRACAAAESPAQQVPLGGEGGETLRGYYYAAWLRQPGPRRPLLGSASPAELGSVLIRKMRSRLGSLADAAQDAALRQRLEAAFGQLSRFGGATSDQLDLYYVLERYRHWGAQRWRQTWRDAWCAFSPAAIGLAYRLPAPVGERGIAEAIIQRYLPAQAYWLPVNGYRLLPLDGEHRAAQLAQLALKRAYAGWRMLRPLPKQSPDHRRGALLAGPLYGLVHDLLSSSASSAISIFGPAGVRRILDEQRAAQRHTEMLGFLVSVELYVRQVRALGRI